MPLERIESELAARVWPVLESEAGAIRTLDGWLRETRHPAAERFRQLILTLAADTYGSVGRGRVTVDTRIEGPVNPDAQQQFLGDVKRLFWGELYTIDSSLATLERPAHRPTILPVKPAVALHRKVG